MNTLLESLDESNPGWRTEECECKHFRVVHANRGAALGHGACTIAGCPCGQFSWVQPPANPRSDRLIENFQRRRGEEARRQEEARREAELHGHPERPDYPR